MKGKINKFGGLCIERAGFLHIAKCYRDVNKICKHSCVAFREPVEVLGAIYGPELGEPTGETKLQLCSEVGTLIFSEFEDERIN